MRMSPQANRICSLVGGVSLGWALRFQKLQLFPLVGSLSVCLSCTCGSRCTLSDTALAP